MSDRGGALTKDILLRVRAQNLSTADFKQVTQSVNELTGALDRQIAAASTGAVKERELAQSLEKLSQAGQGLKSIAGSIEAYKGFEARITASEAALNKAKVALDGYRAEAEKTGASEAAMATREQQLRDAYQRAQASLNTLRTDQAAYAATLERSGFDVANLTAAEDALRGMADQVGAAMNRLTQAKDNYAANVRKTTEALKAQKAAEEELAAAAATRAAAEKQAAEAANTVIGRQQDEAVARAKVKTDAILAEQKAAQEAEAARVAKAKEAEQVNIRANAINQDLALQRITAERVAREKAVEAFRAARQKAIDEERAAEAKAAGERAAASEVLKGREAEALARFHSFAEQRVQGRRRETAAVVATDRAAEEADRKETTRARRRTDAKGKVGAGEGADATRFLGLRPYEITNLGYQISDVFTSGVAGTNPLQIAAQQGPQIVQIFGLAILKWSPIIVAGLAAIATAWGALQRTFREESSNREFAAAILGNNNQLSYAKEQLTAIRKEAHDMGISWKDAGDAIRAAMNQNIAQDRFKPLLQAAQDAKRTYGVDVPQAMKSFSEALSGSAEDILKLNDNYHFLNREQQLYIRQQFAAGQTEEARAFAVEKLTARLREQAKAGLDPWTEASDKLGKAWDDLLVSIGKTQAFKDAHDWLVTLITDLGNLATKIDNIIQNKPGARQGLWDYVVSNVIGDRSLLKKVTDKVGLTGEAAPRSDPSTATAPILPADARFTNPQGLTLSGDTLSKLAQIVAEGSKGLPEGYTVEAISTARRGKSAITKSGGLSEHGFDRAIDIQIRDPKGNVVEGAMGAGGPLYQLLDRAVLMAAEKLAAGEAIAIGSTFSDPDAGHYSMRGREAATNAARRGSMPAPAIRSVTAADETRPTKTGPTDTQIREGQRLVELETEKFRITRATSIEAEKQAELARIKAEVEREVQDPISAREVIRQRSIAATEKLDKERREIEAKEAKERIDDARHYGEVQAAANKAEAEARATGNDRWRDLYDIREKAKAQERDRLARLDAENDRYTQAVKIVDDLKRGLDNTYSSDLEKRIDAINVLYKDQEEVLKRLRDQSPLGDRGRFDEQIGLLPGLRTRKIAQTTGEALQAEAEKAAATRKDLVSAYERQQQAGAITIAEQEEKTKQAFLDTAPAIKEATAALEEWLKTAKELGVPAVEIEKTRAKIAELRAEAEYVDPLFKRLKDTIEDSIGSHLNEAFNTVAESLGNLITKTGTWADVWTSLRTAAGSFFAGVLKDIAATIIKYEALKLLQSTGLTSAGGGLSSLFGSAAGAAAGGGGGLGSLFGSAAGAAGAGAAIGGDMGLVSGAVALLHAGGVAGLDQLPSRSVPASWFDRAPRYHTGSVVGMAANEQAAILQRGEEVVTADNPRHIRNWGGGGGAAPDINIRNVLVADPQLVPSHMASSAGERVIMNTLTRNVATVRQLVR